MTIRHARRWSWLQNEKAAKLAVSLRDANVSELEKVASLNRAIDDGLMSLTDAKKQTAVKYRYRLG